MREYLPEDYTSAQLLGRMDFGHGPSPVLVIGGEVFDISEHAPTSAHFMASWQGDAQAFISGLKPIGSIDNLHLSPCWKRNGVAPPAQLLSPVDLQVVKASGVTFAVSAIERVIEERAMGNHSRASEIRATLAERVGADIRSVTPGSKEAKALKSVLLEESLWSQYLEVAIGPDAEVFTKAPILSTIGWGEPIGVRSDSDWNNPEPEIVVICDGQGRILGATLGNDVNLRDFEGRSALLLGKAKDNNAAASMGPFIRLFDAGFTLDDVRKSVVSLTVKGADGFEMSGQSSMREISRDPESLISQTYGSNHQYPDGFALYLGTMFAPTQDRGEPGRGFTHKVDDRVRISSPMLGTLENIVTHCHSAPRWTFGVRALMENLTQRGLLTP